MTKFGAAENKMKRLMAKEDGNLSMGANLPIGLASVFIELAGANLVWGSYLWPLIPMPS